MNVERLPVQWGGKLTGPDGDVRCRNLICPGGTIPDKYRPKVVRSRRCRVAHRRSWQQLDSAGMMSSSSAC
ncbi:hypothetical protein MTO96_018655 [Rhipicephalus appendiculatus]